MYGNLRRHGQWSNIPATDRATITCNCDKLSYEGACRIADRAAAVGSHKTLRIELDRVVRTTTAALARLIVLRREMLRSGRDLRIAGLHGQPASLYEFNRMASVLPHNPGRDNAQIGSKASC